MLFSYVFLILKSEAFEHSSSSFRGIGALRTGPQTNVRVVSIMRYAKHIKLIVTDSIRIGCEIRRREQSAGKVAERRRWRWKSTFEAESSHWMYNKHWQAQAVLIAFETSNPIKQSETLSRAQLLYDMLGYAIVYSDDLRSVCIQLLHNINDLLAVCPQVEDHPASESDWLLRTPAHASPQEGNMKFGQQLVSTLEFWRISLGRSCVDAGADMIAEAITHQGLLLALHRLRWSQGCPENTLYQWQDWRPAAMDQR